jgi:hypothetical protein
MVILRKGCWKTNLLSPNHLVLEGCETATFLLGWLRMGIHQLIIWLVVEPYPSEKYEFVSWDDEIPNIWKVVKFMFQTSNQI